MIGLARVEEVSDRLCWFHLLYFFFGTDKFITSLQVCCYDCHSEEEQTEYKNTSLYQVSSFVKVLR